MGDRGTLLMDYQCFNCCKWAAKYHWALDLEAKDKKHLLLECECSAQWSLGIKCSCGATPAYHGPIGPKTLPSLFCHECRAEWYPVDVPFVNPFAIEVEV